MERVGRHPEMRISYENKKLIMIFVIIIIVVSARICVSAETYEYDKLNRLVKVVHDDGSYTEYKYDKNGNLISVKVYNKETTKKSRKRQRRIRRRQRKSQRRRRKSRRQQRKSQRQQRRTRKQQRKSRKQLKSMRIRNSRTMLKIE